MSFNEQISFQLYPDSSSADFTISDFYFVRPEYIQVNVYTPAGTVINKAQPADWTIDGKTITRVTVWEAGEVLVTRGNLYNQLNTWRNAEIDFDRELMEWTMDYVTMLTQQNQDLYQKAIHAPLFDAANWFELPIVAVRSGKFMTFDGSGDLVVRELNTTDIGAADIRWLSDFTDYDNGDEWVVYHGEELWQAVASGPVDGVAPNTANPLQWTLLTRGFIKDNEWQNDIDYPANYLVGYNGDLWRAVAAVVAEAPGAVVGNWYEVALGIKEDPLWNAGVAYDQNDIVNYNGVYYIVTDAGGSVVATPPADGSGVWARWTDATYEEISALATITVGRPDHVVFADTTGGSFTVTLSNAFKLGDKITVAALGGNDVTVEGLGLAGETFSDSARVYIYAGTAWMVLSGGGGGASGGLEVGEVTWWPGPTTTTIPVGKLVADGTIVNIVDYPRLFGKIGVTWGGNGTTTFGLPNIQGIFPGALGTQDINGRTKGDVTAVIGDSKEDQMQQIIASYTQGQGDYGSRAYSGAGSGAITLRNVTESDKWQNENGVSGAKVDGFDFDSADSVDARTGDHTDVSRAIGRWIIQVEPPAPQEVNAVVIDVTIGSVRWWGSDTIDQYDLLCDGQSVAKLTYPELYAIVGYTFGGSGDNFNLPNFKGIFPGAKGTQDINGRTKGDGTAVVGDAKEDKMQVITGEFACSGLFNQNGVPQGVGALARGTITKNDRASTTSSVNAQAIALNSANSPDARTDTYTDVPRLIGNWVIRAKNQAAYVIGDQDALVTVILDRVFPVGSVYTQLPGKDTPAVLNYPGTWTNISSELAGDFLRVDGGNASAFESGQQVNQNKSHNHEWYDYVSTADGRNIPLEASTYTFGIFDSNGVRVDLTDSHFNHFDGGAWTAGENAIGSTEGWPNNRTMRIWERTS